MSHQGAPTINPGRINTGIARVDQELNAWAGRLINAIINELVRTNEHFDGDFTISNLNTDRAFDADATSVAELADVLGTLITDLKMRG